MIAQAGQPMNVCIDAIYTAYYECRGRTVSLSSTADWLAGWLAGPSLLFILWFVLNGILVNVRAEFKIYYNEIEWLAHSGRSCSDLKGHAAS